MATPYQKIYDSFLSKIKDYNLGELSDVVMEYDMHSLLESAIPYFLCPKIDIFDRDDAAAEFKNDLGPEEINILGVLMKREWFKRGIADTDVTQQKFGESDFEFKSQASHLNALCNAQVNVIDREVKNLLSNYSRVTRGKIFNYGRLAGK